MKKIFSAMIIALSLLGTAAQAYEGLFTPDENGQLQFEPLRHHMRSCWDNGDEPTPTMDQATPLSYGDPSWGRNRSGTSWQWCDPGHRECPSHLEKRVRYCWEGWSHGWKHCGYTCRPMDRCDYRYGCSYPDPHHRY